MDAPPEDPPDEPDDDGMDEGAPDGCDEPEPEPPPEGEGSPAEGELRPEPPDEPDEPDEPPEEPPGDELGGAGMDEEEDWLAQPPISIADTALTPATWAAAMSSRFSRWRVFICRVFIVSPPPRGYRPRGCRREDCAAHHLNDG